MFLFNKVLKEEFVYLKQQYVRSQFLLIILWVRSQTILESWYSIKQEQIPFFLQNFCNWSIVPQL